jgi:hypothetical protein
MAWALERWLAPYLPNDGPPATSATPDGGVEEGVSVVANVARATIAFHGGWGEAEEERAAIAEFDGDPPRAWAEALARLDLTKPPADVPPRRCCNSFMTAVDFSIKDGHPRQPPWAGDH